MSEEMITAASREEQPSKKQHYADESAYPDICVKGENRAYARAMLDNVGGLNSEMNAVSSYFYSSLMTSRWCDVAQAFHQISIVEMHHLHIFSELARQLGEDPRLWGFQGCRRVYWSPCYNKYPCELKPLLLMSIQNEKEAVRKYEAQKSCIYDENIRANLSRIIMDEKLHIAIYENLYEKYFCEKPVRRA